jgi:hypothetical protein
MDLPVELRIKIAKYALTSEHSLPFRWVQNSASDWVGTFYGLDKLTAFTRVSTQAYGEFKDLVWVVNEFMFDPAYLLRLETLEGNWVFDDLKLIGEAFTLFSRNVRYTNRFPVTVHLTVTCHEGTGRTLRNLQSIDQTVSHLIKQAPQVRCKIYDAAWTVRTFGLQRDRYAVDEFDTVGKCLVACLAQLDASGTVRKWKLHPELLEYELEDVRQALISAGVEDGDKWIDEGI